MKPKFGFEIECNTPTDILSDEYYETKDFGIVEDELYNSRNIISNIKDDGTVDKNHGFEINSRVFNNIDGFKKGLIKLTKDMRLNDYYGASPCAIHIHCSDLRFPHKFRLLSHVWDYMYSIIRSKNGSDLMYDISTLCLDPPHGYQKINNHGEFIRYLEESNWSYGRSRTIRNRIDTLEFRPIPTRLSSEYITTWLKIYETLHKKSHSMSLKDIQDLYEDVRTNPISMQIKQFMEVLRLDYRNLWVLTHKVTNNNDILFDNLMHEVESEDINLRTFMEY